MNSRESNVVINPRSLTINSEDEGELVATVSGGEGGYEIAWASVAFNSGELEVVGSSHTDICKFKAKKVEADITYSVSVRAFTSKGLLGSDAVSVTVTGNYRSCIDPEASKYDLWNHDITYEAEAFVCHNNMVWKSKWHALKGKEPGGGTDSDNTWNLESNLPVNWRNDKAYPGSNVVNHKGSQYRAKWEASVGAEPGSGNGDAWEKIGEAACNPLKKK